MRDCVEQAIDAAGRRAPVGARRPAGRTVTVNRRESALAWLAARGLVTRRQEEAGERLRSDYERAAIGPAVTMRWSPRVDGGRGARTLDAGEAQTAAKRRFDGALGAAGPGLSDVLWRVVCAGEPLAEAEKGLGWPTRSARLVLAFALDRAADHYGLP
ncbi:DUF6456 domain-containing protein [Sphingomonas corticis]|jgi:hypothetical protein|uniref:DUF6456 domain-containing protein n=1 Tax=Sphingomonas corticis TaxID=2722791 RepID=A0ABX1CP01_9SPHN|nr:DUF6456 domain-containing protein [Sphingomonas corticis]NJR79209.1 hypothetical protein [Sphingomonas corticis]